MATLCFLDFDVDGARGRFARAAEFVEACGMRYGLSSADLSELGGRELAMLPSYYEADFDWCTPDQRSILSRPQPACRVIVELLPDSSPLACENFAALCVGDRGRGKGSGLPLHYKDSRVHRVQTGFVIQCGDFVFGNGSGGESVFGKKFKDDKGGLKLKHDRPGVVSMGNTGKNSNGSQFFITLARSPQCDGKHVVFGRVVSGMSVVRYMARMAGTTTGEPSVDVRVIACGMYMAALPRQGYWNPRGEFVARPVKQIAVWGDDVPAELDEAMWVSAERSGVVIDAFVVDSVQAIKGDKRIAAIVATTALDAKTDASLRRDLPAVPIMVGLSTNDILQKLADVPSSTQ